MAGQPFKLHCRGTVNACPTCNRRGSKRGLAAISVVIFTPYLRAITDGVSPDLTVCVRVAVDTGSERESSALDGKEEESVTDADDIDRIADAVRSALGAWPGGFVSAWRWVA